MRRSKDVLARAVQLAMGIAVAVLLAGCMITSKAPLVGPDEGVSALPATFYLFGYDEKDGSYARNADAPTAFTLDGKSYTSADKTMKVEFVPVAGTAGTYLVAITSSDAYLYGIARYRDDILEANIVLSDSEPGKLIDAEKASGGAGADALSGVTVEDSGLTVTTRAALDHLVQMNVAGRLPMSPVVAYIADSAGATAPQALAADGDFYKAQ